MNNPETNSYYAIRPLNNQLVTQTVSIQGYQKGIGLTGSRQRTYAGVDMEHWALEFLQALGQFMDVFISTSDNRAVTHDIKTVLDAREALIEAIPAGVAALFPPFQADDGKLLAARTALSIALAKSLSGGYGVAVILVDKDNKAILFTPGTELADFKDVPLPLRSFPRPPVLVSQTSQASYPDADTVSRARQVDYVFQFNSDAIQRDSLYIDLTRAEAALKTGTQANNDLFAALAQFMAVWPALQKDLPEHYNPKLLPAKAVTNAIKIFADLTGKVAEAWAGYWANHINQAPVVPANCYVLTKQFRPDNAGLLNAVFLSIPAQHVALIPSIAVRDSAGQLQQLTASKVNDTLWIYKPGADTESLGTDFTIAFPTGIFSIGQWFPVLHLLRNNFEYINPEFVYQTADVTFPSVDIPYITQNGTIELERTLPRSTVLKELFEQLIPATAIMRISLRISFLAQNDPMPPLPLPVLLLPEAVYNESVIDAINGQLTQWLSEYKNGAAGYFQMELTIFNTTGAPVFGLSDVRFK